jgi:hypothetical protein
MQFPEPTNETKEAQADRMYKEWTESERAKTAPTERKDNLATRLRANAEKAAQRKMMVCYDHIVKEVEKASNEGYSGMTLYLEYFPCTSEGCGDGNECTEHTDETRLFSHSNTRLIQLLKDQGLDVSPEFKANSLLSITVDWAKEDTTKPKQRPEPVKETGPAVSEKPEPVSDKDVDEVLWRLALLSARSRGCPCSACKSKRTEA